MSERPFRILGLQQIAIGGLDKARLAKLWVDTLGVPLAGNYRSERENVDEDILALGAGVHRIEVDLMQPVDPARKPAVHETPLNHVGLWVDDLPQAVEWLSANGVRFAPGGIRKGAAGYDICFIHPKGNEQFPIGGEGVLIELVQAPPEVIAAFQREYVAAVKWMLDDREAAGEFVATELPQLGLDAAVMTASLESITWKYTPAEDAMWYLNRFYGRLSELSPEVVGGKLPDDAFYYAP